MRKLDSCSNISSNNSSRTKKRTEELFIDDKFGCIYQVVMVETIMDSLSAFRLLAKDERNDKYESISECK